MEDPGAHDALISTFCGVTGASSEEAEQYLLESKGDVDLAVAQYYATRDDDQGQSGHDEQHINPSQAVLTSSSTPKPAKSKPSGQKKTNSKKFATLDDVRGNGDGEHEGHGHDHDEDTDEDYADPEEKQDMFAGGEKSGLAVQNPKDPREQVKKLLEKARKHTPRPEGEDEPSRKKSNFSGAGQTLGGDDAPSRIIPDPNTDDARQKPYVKRTLTLWNDGFSVDDGPLYKFSDPNNRRYLDLIQQGKAPLEIMDVDMNQPVDVTLVQMRTDYVPPKKKYKPFSGAGQRLGSPTPGEAESSSQPLEPAPSSNTVSPAVAAPTAPYQIDSSLPSISLQIRLGDGTRLTARFNTTQTIGDVFSFVNASSTSSASRAWTLMTTFPSKELDDKTKVLGDIAELKRGGVVVQKWL